MNALDSSTTPIALVTTEFTTSLRSGIKNPSDVRPGSGWSLRRRLWGHTVMAASPYVERQAALLFVCPQGPSGPKGKLFGSSVRIGESELATVMSKGWMSSVAETLHSSDMALLSVCSSCRRLSILCDCSGQRSSTTLVLMRSSLAKFDICRAVYTINANVPGATEAGVKCRPESFRYYT